jgi:hypothetical protein
MHIPVIASLSTLQQVAGIDGPSDVKINWHVALIEVSGEVDSRLLMCTGCQYLCNIHHPEITN